ncbi:WD_REPEATS_REGION domain-containing protein, partial [Linnemannia exigua]
MAAAGLSAVTNVFKLDPAGLFESLESLQKLAESMVGVVTVGIEGCSTLRQGAGTTVRATEGNFDAMKKRSWYLALQGTALFIRQGRLHDFKQVALQAPCRNNVNFQWGVCRQLGEIAFDQLWDDETRQQAVDFLGDLYGCNTGWKLQEDVKRWILTILLQISGLEDSLTKDRALVLLKALKRNGVTELSGIFPLRVRLPLPASFPLLTRVQETPKVEYDLHKLKMQRIDRYKQGVYIAPWAKPSLQAPDDNLFLLMDKVEEFLVGDGQVMLILGDSGAGKSTFNRYLEYLLWQRYKPGGPIPLFINLPGLERPEKNLIAEQLMEYSFSESQIQELEQHRRFILICDGYDESQLLTNLHTTNALNQEGKRDAKLFITCRTQYLGHDYRDRFVPKAADQYHQAANDLFQEAVIAPLSKDQIELYVEKYVPLEPTTWVKKDYMDKLTIIPNLMDLVMNPFLLTLALETLPKVVEGKTDLSRLRVIRVELFDKFVKHWLGVNKRRLQGQKLKDEKQEALQVLLTDGFERNGIDFQKKLAVAIFREQDGRPIVEYSQFRDKATWKNEFFSTDVFVTLQREACLLSRVGNQTDKEFDPQVYLGSTGDNLSVGNHLLSTRNLVPEPSIIQFLAERVQVQHAFKMHLLALIELSKSDPGASQAAANAITIL